MNLGSGRTLQARSSGGRDYRCGVGMEIASSTTDIKDIYSNFKTAVILGSTPKLGLHCRSTNVSCDNPYISSPFQPLYRKTLSATQNTMYYPDHDWEVNKVSCNIRGPKQQINAKCIGLIIQQENGSRKKLALGANSKNDDNSVKVNSYGVQYQVFKRRR